MLVMLSCSRAVTMKSNSFLSSLIRGAKKLAWNGVLIATQIFFTLAGSEGGGAPGERVLILMISL